MDPIYYGEEKDEMTRSRGWVEKRRMKGQEEGVYY